jgi:hypothetical protein
VDDLLSAFGALRVDKMKRDEKVPSIKVVSNLKPSYDYFDVVMNVTNRGRRNTV